MERIQKTASTSSTKGAEATTVELPNKQADLSDIDDLLDEIDSVLETNAEEFVTGYVQRGGQ